MKAVIKRVEFMGKVGVGTYIHGALHTFIVRAVDLLDTIEGLKVMGYDLEVRDESELEDEMSIWELEEEALLDDWED